MQCMICGICSIIVVWSLQEETSFQMEFTKFNFNVDWQDPESGGISDRPNDAVDVFHTFFGVAG